MLTSLSHAATDAPPPPSATEKPNGKGGLPPFGDVAAAAPVEFKPDPATQQTLKRMKAIEKLGKENPGLRFQQLYTSVDYTKGQYKAAIPTFWAMDLIGFTLNFMTLLALSLVAGVLVDDAIVEIENIVRHMRMGKSAYQASIDAADEIGLAVLATTMAIVAVFLPVGLMPGISGQFFKNFGFTVVVAVLMSLFVARLITPLMAAYMLKSHGPEPHGENVIMRGYLRALQFTLRHRWTTVVAGIATLVLTGVLFSQLSFTFMPAQDRDFSTVRVFLPPGSTRAQAEQAATRAHEIVQRAPEVVNVVERVNVGSASLNLTLSEDRKRTSTEIERSIAPQLAAIPDARVNFQSQSGGGPEGGGGGGRDITLHLGSEDPVLLFETANKIAKEMETLSQVRAPRVQGDLVRP